MSLISGLVIGLLFGMLARLISGKWRYLPLFLIANIAYTWLSLPTLQYGFTDIPLIFLVNSLALMGLATGRLFSSGRAIPNAGVTSKRQSKIALSMVGLSVLALLIIPFVTSFAGFYAKKYYDLPGEVAIGEFSDDVAAIDMSQVRRVDSRLARNVADKRLGEDRGLGSRVSIGSMSIQTVKGKLYWVGPLEHSKFRRWLDNRSGTPGYVMVSASNENDVELVLAVNEKPLTLRYNMGAYFKDKPERYVYDNGYAAHGRTDWTFEIDDQGRPFYVVTDYKKRIGFKGADAVGVIVLDVQNGEIKNYAIDEAPKWIDRIQPSGFMRRQLNDWGKFKQGWMNSWLGADGVLKTTKGMSLVYGNDGNSYFYTGMQSVGSDEGTVGFVLINTRTKDMRLYEQAGATEVAARNSAEDEFQDFGYRATNPILYNIGGIPTYFMTMKASSGLVKAAAFVSVEDYSLVGSGKTTETALRNYNQALRGRGNAVAMGDIENYQSVEGTVLRVRQETIEQTVTYYVLIDSAPDRLFAIASDLAPMVRMTASGDVVTLSYQEDGNAVVDVLAFDNGSINSRTSKVQSDINEQTEGTLGEP
ncbi:MAG: hypothetical protein ABJN69_07885 [Hellea sp.]